MLQATQVSIRRSGHILAKDFRPISLTSFLMKTLDRMIDIHIRENTEKQHLSNAQLAYRKGRSTETALHEVVCHIEKSLHFNQYTMATFLGAFNNVNAKSILSSLNSIGIEGDIRAWIGVMLTSRTITAELSGT
ncbi:uncharacterized protein [Drosophila takahashii]|uniref:uncharacterized protein n=1 Tax=Drosophila takahashii TaxID=29030 RepID=UPI003899036B